GLQIHILQQRNAALQTGQVLDIEHGCDDSRCDFGIQTFGMVAHQIGKPGCNADKMQAEFIQARPDSS
ncbi:MAG: hypothetical protein WCB93_00560, partial [Gallionella sp.]